MASNTPTLALWSVLQSETVEIFKVEGFNNNTATESQGEEILRPWDVWMRKCNKQKRTW